MCEFQNRKFSTSTNSPDVDNTRLRHAQSDKIGPRTRISQPDILSVRTLPNLLPDWTVYRRYTQFYPLHTE